MEKEKVGVAILLAAVAIFFVIVFYYVGKSGGYNEGLRKGSDEAMMKYAGTLLPLERGKVYLAVVVGIDATEEKSKDNAELKHYRLQAYGLSAGDKYLVNSTGEVSRIRID